jgi:dolichol-phosphate mannosyltransferase
LDARFSAIRLSRNFGSHLAITAGLDRAHGDAAAILACDLQDPVETVIEFLKKWEEGYEIVWGERAARVDASWRIFTSKLFTAFLKRWVMPKQSKFTTGSFLLIDRKVIDCFCLYEDNSRLTFAMVAWTGFRQTVIPYNRRARQAGKTGWTFSRMISAFYNAVLAYSTIPLKFAAILGILSFFLGIFFGIYVLYLYLIGYTEAIGWKSTVLIIIGFSGIILLQLSIIGEYLSRIYKDASRRPLYFVSDDTNPERYTVSRPWEIQRGSRT